MLTDTPRCLHNVHARLIYDLFSECLQDNAGRQPQRSRAGLLRCGHRRVLALAQPTAARTLARKSAGTT
jgi:hypothetical protein